MTSAPPRSFAALRHPGFRPYLIYSALAMMADSIEHVISYWVIFQRFHSPALGGFAVVSHWLPFLLFAVYSGALSDRFDPRRIIQIGMFFFMLSSLSWAVFIVTNSQHEWLAGSILVIHGFAGVLWGPASQVLIHDIVGREQLQSAVRLNATSRYLGLLMGPAVGGVILLVLGPLYGILLNVTIYLPLVLWLWKAPYGPKFRKEKAGPPRAIRGLADIVSTIQAIRLNRTLVAMIMLAGAASFFVGNGYQPQMPEFAQDLGKLNAGFYYTMLYAADATGAFIAGIFLETTGFLQARPRTAFILAMMWCCAIATFAMTGIYPVALAALFAAGFLELSFSSMAQTLIQLGAPSDIRGRVIGVYSMSGFGLKTFSGLTIGIAGSYVGIHWSLGTSASLLLIVVAGLLFYTSRTPRAVPVSAE